MTGPACAVPVVDCADEMCGTCAMCTRCCNCPVTLPVLTEIGHDKIGDHTVSTVVILALTAGQGVEPRAETLVFDREGKEVRGVPALTGRRCAPTREAGEAQHAAMVAAVRANVAPPLVVLIDERLDCVRTASCEPGDHSYSWPCVYEWGRQERGTASQDRKLTAIGGLRLALGIVAVFWIAVAVGVWMVAR